MPKERIVAVGLFTKGDLDLLGNELTRVWPVEEAPCFAELLRAIDEANAELNCSVDGSDETPVRGKP